MSTKFFDLLCNKTMEIRVNSPLVDILQSRGGETNLKLGIKWDPEELLSNDSTYCICFIT